MIRGGSGLKETTRERSNQERSSKGQRGEASNEHGRISRAVYWPGFALVTDAYAYKPR